MQLRALRAAIFTALVVTLSAASHVLLSRVPLPLTTVAGLSAGVFAVAYALCGRERGYWRIASLLVPLELAADTVFTTGQDVCYGPGGGPVAGCSLVSSRQSGLWWTNQMMIFIPDRRALRESALTAEVAWKARRLPPSAA